MDNKNFSDLNELFSLHYNFDKLKVLLSNILSKQNETEKKLKQQEIIVQNLFNKEYNSKNRLDNSLNNTIEKNNEKEKTVSSSPMITSQNNITLKQTNESTKKKISAQKQISEPNIEESNLENKLFEKLNEQNKLYEELNNKIKNLEESQKIFNISFKEIKKNQDNIKLENNGLQSNIQDLFENIENINIKISGLNFYDALKNIKANNSDIDITKTLIEELEKKTFQKFGCVDNKLKKNENDIFSIKNDIFNNKNKIENLNEIYQIIQKENLNQKDEFIKIKEEINKNINYLIETQYNNLNDKIDKIKNEISELNKPTINIENEINKLNNSINNNNNDLSQSLYIKISDKLHKLENNHKENIKELSNKIENILKEIKYLINIDTLQIEKDRISQLKGKLDNLLDEFDITKTNVNQNSNSLRLLTNKIEKLNFTMIEGKENFSTSISNIKSNKNKNKKELNEEHYIDNKTFNSFISIYKKDIEKIKKEHENNHKIFTDIYETLSNKIDIKEYKNTKDYFNNVIEDLNNKLETKYLIKFEINKLIRSLQNQIKLIIETMPKENNNYNSTSSNWLLANKPLGYFCASCENYIGDLTNNENSNTFYRNQTNPINLKDINCGYRIGNGFSRILSRLKIEEKKKENPNLSDDNNKTYFSDGEDKIASLENEILGKNIDNNINEAINEKIEENHNHYYSNNINSSTLNNNVLKKLPEIIKCQTEKSIFKLQKKNKETNQLKTNDEAPKM